jgi:DNA-binding FadR family transcriptional regulator
VIGEAIVSGRYKVGESLPAEPLLCDALGVSRTVVRESVKSLIAKGLLSSGPRSARECSRRTTGTGSTRTSWPGIRGWA